MPSRLHVLLVEDSEDDAELLALVLKRGGYSPILRRVETPKALHQALQDGTAWDVVISDYTLPHFNGMDALEIIKESGLDIPFILLSGTIGEDVAVNAMIQGARDYIMKNKMARLVPAIEREMRETKVRCERKQAEDALFLSEAKLSLYFQQSPLAIIEWNQAFEVTAWNAVAEKVFGYSWGEAVGHRIDELIVPKHVKEFVNQIMTGLLATKSSQHGINENCTKDGRIILCEWFDTPVIDKDRNVLCFTSIARDITASKQQEEQLKQAHTELALAYDSTIEGWAQALEMRDMETEGHCQRVTELTLQIARELGVSEAYLVHYRRGTFLHDIGKMAIPDSILFKPGPLTTAEWGIMRLHPVYAHKLLSEIKFLTPAIDIPYSHHEKWDGSGYPLGLVGEEIPLAARVFAVVDVWDALTSDRPYRPAWTGEAALAYIVDQSGKHFDPQVVNIFLQIEHPLGHAKLKKHLQSRGEK